jgi:hypothetical protein
MRIEFVADSANDCRTDRLVILRESEWIFQQGGLVSESVSQPHVILMVLQLR